MATKLPGSVADHGVGNGQKEPSEDRLDDAQESDAQGAIEGPVASTRNPKEITQFVRPKAGAPSRAGMTVVDLIDDFKDRDEARV